MSCIKQTIDGVVIQDSTGDWRSSKVSYVFEDTAERDAFFVTNPSLLATDALIVIKDDTPPPTPGVRSLDFSKAINSQYITLVL